MNLSTSARKHTPASVCMCVFVKRQCVRTHKYSNLKSCALSHFVAPLYICARVCLIVFMLLCFCVCLIVRVFVCLCVCIIRIYFSSYPFTLQLSATHCNTLCTVRKCLSRYHFTLQLSATHCNTLHTQEMLLTLSFRLRAHASAGSLLCVSLPPCARPGSVEP